MAIQQYLSRYAEKEASYFDDFVFNYFHVICIPAFAEAPDFLDTLVSEIKPISTLVILVINAHHKASSEQIQQTQDIATYLKQTCQLKASYAQNIHLIKLNNSIDVLIVERCIPELFVKEKEGVGLARKIACDIACGLIAQGKIITPWIHSTDADAILPADYFSSINSINSEKVSVGIYPFRHTPNPDKKVQQAQSLYDLSMEYYVAGLEWAGSPWAYHTIGSTLLINADHYTQARGFPKRQAGEDFYLLNKLAKIGNILKLKATPISLASRLSERVPFGTGPALNKIMAMEKPIEQYLYYHPHCFLYLKCWLTLAQTLQAGKEILLSADFIEQFIIINEDYTSVDSQVLMNCLQALGINKTISHAFSHSKSNDVLARHMKNWFDGFITLKFIHWMRDNYLSSQSLQLIQAEDLLPFAFVLENYAPGQTA